MAPCTAHTRRTATTPGTTRHTRRPAPGRGGGEELGLTGPVDPDTFKAVLEGRVPEGPHLGKRDKDGGIHHRPGRDVTLSAPKSVSLIALLG